MVEFGARLSLKDNMSAAIKKNLMLQKKFSEQVKTTNENVKKLAKAKAKPIIEVKDKITAPIKKVTNALKTVGKFVAKPFVMLKDGATKVISKVSNGIKAIGKLVAKPVAILKDKVTAGLSKIKSMMSTLAKGFTIAVGIAGAGASLIAGGAISEGASLEQSIGGVNTLFGDDAGKTVKANADKAFKTAGLSANAYMETVTGFSASLISSLKGDTAKAATVADMAIIDMADNVNRFGGDMQSIQNAYSGFARGNYTMLDNLKLGYSGSQEEMERLLKDAQKISGVKYNIKNLSDVYSAIHVIQDKLGVAGATAAEAEGTFTGSFAAMKSAASNLLGNMAIGGDVEGSMEQLVESASIFLFNNAIPMIGRVISSLPSAISTGIKKAAPKIKESGGEIVKSIKDGIMSLLPTSLKDALTTVLPQIGGVISAVMPLIEGKISHMGTMFNTWLPVVTDVLSMFVQTVKNVFPIVSQVFTTVSNVVTPIVQGIAGLIQSALPLVQNIITMFTNAVATVLPVVSSIFTSVGDKIKRVIGVVQKHMGLLQKIFELVSPIVQGAISSLADILSAAWSIISPIVDVAITVFDALLSCAEKVFPTVQTIIEGVWSVLEGIFGGIADGLSKVGDAISGVADFVGNGINAIGGWLGFAYGKDRVPYDNYPAMLHAGERVLTRNQADQYDRVMSTRGLQVTGKPLAVPQSTASGASGTTVSIDKLADTVVIEKDADVDKVVEEMITKFRKLVPNMA